MKNRTHFLSSASVAVVLALSTMPCAASDELSGDESALPVIRVIVDHDAQLALVPQGTILPEGFQVFASMLGEDADLVETGRTLVETRRPLVFAYAPKSRFSKLKVTSTPADASKTDIHYSDSDRDGASAPQGGNPCPAVFIVEFGPEMIHQVTCSYKVNAYGTSESVIPRVTYPTYARSASLGLVVEWSSGQDSTSQGICLNGTCFGAGFGVTFPISREPVCHSNTTVRLPGACTQDPLFCPIYSSTIVVPIFEP